MRTSRHTALIILVFCTLFIQWSRSTLIMQQSAFESGYYYIKLQKTLDLNTGSYDNHPYIQFNSVDGSATHTYEIEISSIWSTFLYDQSCNNPAYVCDDACYDMFECSDDYDDQTYTNLFSSGSGHQISVKYSPLADLSLDATIHKPVINTTKITQTNGSQF